MKNLVLLTVLFCASASAFERTRVVRVPNGTSGAITSISVTAYFYEYVGATADEGNGVQSYKMTWTETTAGALSGNRSLAVSTYPPGEWSGTTNITATFASTWSGLFYISCVKEDPEDYSSRSGRLDGFTWFSPPDDTNTWTWSTADDQEDPPDLNPPAVAGTVWPALPIQPLPTGSGVYTGTIISDLPWLASTVGTVPVHARSAKAYVRVENDPAPLTRRFISLVWEEHVSAETANRYICTFQVEQSGTPWQITNITPLIQVDQSSNGAALKFVGRTVNLGAGTAGGTMQLTGASGYGDRVATNSSGAANVFNYRAIVQRFLNAYLRDHGDATNVVQNGFQETDALAYYPEAPPGAFAFDHTAPLRTGTGYTSVPLFDQTGPGTVGGGSGTGSGGGLSASDFTGSGLPGGAGTRTVGSAGTMPGNPVTSFGGLISSWNSFSPTEQAECTVDFSLPLPGQEDPTVYTLSSLPDTETPQGAALDAFRILLRTALTVLMLYKFFRLCYATLVPAK